MKTKLRTSKITIEMPKEDGEVWVRVTIQQVIYDDSGNVTNVIPRYDFITRPLRDFISDDYTYYELDGTQKTISGLNVMLVLTGVIQTWIRDKYPVEQDEEGNLWLS